MRDTREQAVTRVSSTSLEWLPRQMPDGFGLIGAYRNDSTEPGFGAREAIYWSDAGCRVIGPFPVVEPDADRRFAVARSPDWRFAWEAPCPLEVDLRQRCLLFHRLHEDVEVVAQFQGFARTEALGVLEARNEP